MKRILIACQCATNKGDRAIAEYLISNLGGNKNIELVLSTSEPNLWSNLSDKSVKVIGMGYRAYGCTEKTDLSGKISREITALIYNKILFRDMLNEKSDHKRLLAHSKEFLTEVKKADLVIVTGGHHITSIRNKDALFSYTYDIGLISIFAKKYILWSQTVGPLEFTSEKVKIFFGNVIKNAESVYIRDVNSIECIKKLYGHQTNIIKTYDSVFGFGSKNYGVYEEREKKVGISIFNGLQKAFGTFSTIAQILDEMAEKGYTIEFFRMEFWDKEESDIKSVISMMKNQKSIKIFPFETTTEEHLAELSTCEIYIGYKTHSVIMALATGTPLLAIAYHEKTVDFMREYGLEAYAVGDENLSESKVKIIIDNLLAEKYHIHSVEEEKSTYLSSVLKKNIKEILHDVTK